MLVYLDDYRKARTDADRDGVIKARLKNGTYGDDVLHANWNPAVLCAFDTPAQRMLSPDLPEDMSTIDIDAFMNRIYALASQV
jgi:hypothetical protein